MSYLHAFGQSGATIGVDINPWDENILSGNPAFIISNNDNCSGYTNISTIINYDIFGKLANLSHKEIKDEIKNLWSQNKVWSAHTVGDQKILAKHFIVDKSFRDKVLTQKEQDDYNYFKIYDFIAFDVKNRFGYLNSKITPKSLDYKKDVTQRFHPEYNFNDNGSLSGVNYYEQLDVVTVSGVTVQNFSNPIIKYTADYFLNSDNYVTHRIINRSWAMADDTWSSDIKTTIKKYDSKTARDEGVRRRKNLINNLLIDTVGLIYMTSSGLTTISQTESDAIIFLRELDSAINIYYESGPKLDAQGNPCLLVQKITASTYDKLDNLVPNGGGATIRQFIIGRLNL